MDPNFDLWPSRPGRASPPAAAPTPPSPIPLVLLSAPVAPLAPLVARMTPEQERAEVARLQGELDRERQLRAAQEQRQAREEALASLRRTGYAPKVKASAPAAPGSFNERPKQPGETAEQYQARMEDVRGARAYAERRNREEARNRR